MPAAPATGLDPPRDSVSKSAALTLGTVCKMIYHLLADHEICLAMELLKELDESNLARARVDNISLDGFMAQVSTFIDDYGTKWSHMKMPLLTERIGLLATRPSQNSLNGMKYDSVPESDSQRPSKCSESSLPRATSFASWRERLPRTDRDLHPNVSTKTLDGQPSPSSQSSNRSQDLSYSGYDIVDSQEKQGVTENLLSDSDDDQRMTGVSGLGSFNFAQYLASTNHKTSKGTKGTASDRIDSCESLISVGRVTYHNQADTLENVPPREHVHDGQRCNPTRMPAPMRPVGSPLAQRPRKKDTALPSK